MAADAFAFAGEDLEAGFGFVTQGVCVTAKMPAVKRRVSGEGSALVTCYCFPKFSDGDPFTKSPMKLLVVMRYT